MRTELQRISVQHILNAGWINTISRLSSYSKVSLVNTELAKHGIKTYQIEELIALTCSLLGSINISLTIPTILLSAFDNKYYESSNEDVWIDKYCPDFAIYDYKGVIVDIIQVGYTVSNKEIHKALVSYT